MSRMPMESIFCMQEDAMYDAIITLFNFHEKTGAWHTTVFSGVSLYATEGAGATRDSPFAAAPKKPCPKIHILSNCPEPSGQFLFLQGGSPKNGEQELLTS